MISLCIPKSWKSTRFILSKSLMSCKNISSTSMPRKVKKNLQKIRYLVHIISKEGIRMDPEKLKVIDEWPVPKNLHEVRSFIGMCSYYRRFIAKFSIIASPLHDLTKKKVDTKRTHSLSHPQAKTDVPTFA